MPRPAKPYLCRKWWVTNTGGRRHKGAPKGASKKAVNEAFRALLRKLQESAAPTAAPSQTVTPRPAPASPAQTVSPLPVAQLVALFLDHRRDKVVPHGYENERYQLGRFAARLGDRPAA